MDTLVYESFVLYAQTLDVARFVNITKFTDFIHFQTSHSFVVFSISCFIRALFEVSIHFPGTHLLIISDNWAHAFNSFASYILHSPRFSSLNTVSFNNS